MDQQGKLSQAEKQRFIEAIRTRQKPPGRPMHCEVCGISQWVVGDHLTQPATFVPGVGLSVGGLAYLFAQLICGNCGNTKLINAFVIGLVDPSKPIESDHDGGI